MGRIERKLILFWVFLPVLALAVFPRNADAIPAFARKYQTSCVLCHAPMPRLNALGEAFRLNGYKLPQADEIYVKEEPVSLGAEAYKRVFPEAIWPSTIPGMPPIAVRATGAAAYHPFGSQTNRTEFDFPAEVTLIGAGAFGENLAFFAHLGFEVEDGSTTTTPLAWLMWQNLFSGALGRNHLNIKAGNVGRHTIALPNTRGENSFFFQDYLYAAELDLDNEPGFQVNGFGRHWRYAAGVVEADSQNSDKDLYAALALKFGGLGYDGSGSTSPSGGTGTNPSAYWQDNSLHLGFFSYRSHIGADGANFDRIGGDARVNYANISVAGGYVYGDNHATAERKHIWFAEAYYFVFPWLIPYLRYENMIVKQAAPGDQARFVAGAAMLLRANIRVNVEAAIYMTNDSVEAVGGKARDADQIVLSLDWAF